MSTGYHRLKISTEYWPIEKGQTVKMVFLILSIALICSGSWAQTTPVVMLSSGDAARVKRVHQEMLDAEQAWNALQTDISDRYLVVDKKDAAASEVKWYPRGTTFTGISSPAMGFYTGTAMVGGDTQAACETPEEKRKDLERQFQQEAQQAELEAWSRRVRKGWEVKNCGNCEPVPFDYSDDYRFLVKKPPANDPPGTIRFSPTYPLGGWVSPASTLEYKNE